MNKLLATVDEDFAQIDRLLKELRNRIARAAEAVHVVAQKVAKQKRQRAARPTRTRARNLA